MLRWCANGESSHATQIKGWLARIDSKGLPVPAKRFPFEPWNRNHRRLYALTVDTRGRWG